MDYLKIRTKWTIVTVVFVVLIRKSDGDTADMVVSSKVNWPPWIGPIIPGARRCSHVTVNSAACRWYVRTDLTCRFAERQVVCKTYMYIHKLLRFANSSE